MSRILLLVAACLFIHLSGEGGDKSAKGFHKDLQSQIDEAKDKIMQLSEATPEEKYGWRPAEGVRSVGEVYMHIVVGNYLFPTFMGTAAPEGFSPDLDKKVTKKAEVKEWLMKSFDHIHAVVDKTSDEELGKEVDFFGTKRTTREMLLILLSHLHEHLGQSIAYGRINGVVPPWSAKAE